MIKRLDRILSENMNISRKDARKMICGGKVQVNENVCVQCDFKADGEKDEIRVEGREIICREHIYIMMNKPAGVISASEGGREKTVIDILPQELKRKGLFPAGRLDKDTVGFMLITDDGEFAHNILSPRHHVKKTYIASLEKPMTKENVEEFRRGVTLGDGTECLSAEAEMTGELTAKVVLSEGRYHQVKRMFAAQGNRVLSLKRTSIGALELDEGLQAGECRLITPDELKMVTEGK